MAEPSVFDSEIPLPDDRLAARARTLLGFDARYARVKNHLRLMLGGDEIAAWNKRHHGGCLGLCDLIADQYPLALFHGDVGTGKSAFAECIANRLVTEAKARDSVLFKLSNRVRGRGLVGQLGSGVLDAFQAVLTAAGKQRRAVMVIDEGDSLGANRAQEQSHHEDKVGVNSLIQAIDDLRRLNGRVLVILCTNRLSSIDPALRRRAALQEEFTRPTPNDRRALFQLDMAGLNLEDEELRRLVDVTGPRDGHPGWTYSDIRTRLYPAALAKAFPERGLKFEDLEEAAASLHASPAMGDH
jgi:AAA+ superfamily predicted ATPase